MMLGEQFAEFKGKVVGQRVIDVEPLTTETTVSAKGSVKGTQVTELITFVGRPTTTEGVVHGKGRGVIMAAAGESEVTTYTGEGIGRSRSSGIVSWRGSIFLTTSSNGRLSLLNNVIGLFEDETDSEGNFSSKFWEWK